MPVVMTLPISTMNITGLRACLRGSSLGNESLIAAQTISCENMLADSRAISDSRSDRVRGSVPSTFTPGSPNRPIQRPSVFWEIRC